MKKHQIAIKLDRAAAALAGTDMYDNIIVDVNPSTLTDRQRKALASLKLERILLPDGREEYLPIINLPGLGRVDDIPILLEEVARLEEEKAAIRERAIEEAVKVQTQRILDCDPSDLILSRNGIFTSKLGDSWFWPLQNMDEVRARVLQDPRVATLAQKVSAEIERLNMEEKARRAAEKVAREKEEKAAKERREKQLKEWVLQYGTESQRKRFSRGMLPEQEIIDGIRDKAFRALDGFLRHQKITADEVINAASGQLDDELLAYAKVDFLAVDETECDEALFSALERIEEAIRAEHPDAKCTLRRHTGWIKGYPDAPAITRHSVRVELTVGELRLSREYAAD